jgi:ATP-dependent helicase HrpB
LSLLDFDADCHLFCARVEFVRGLEGEADIGDWPSFSAETLLAEAGLWLGPALGAVRGHEQLKKLRLLPLLRNRLGWRACVRLDEVAPESLILPGGRRVALEYQKAGPPVLAVCLQELFGWDATPRVAGGRVPVQLRILSPARRPIQVTDDLAGFWRGSYATVRKEMRGRYPKHAWPEHPWEKSPGSVLKS